MRGFFISSLILCLSACTLHASFTPEGEALKDAVIGINYSDEISITGGRVSALAHDAIHERFVGSISPQNTGLYIQHCNGDYFNNNCVQIRGVPVKTGVVNVRVSGHLFGTNISTGSSFDKTYTLTIKNADGTQ